VEDISFRTIREVFNSADSTWERTEEKRRLAEAFRTKEFGELKTQVNEKQRQADQRMDQLLNVLRLPKDTLPMATTANGTVPNDLTSTISGPSKVPLNTYHYPELFTY
jgi:hypothetical protein